MSENDKIWDAIWTENHARFEEDGRLYNDLRELRFRLQALEQNAVPSREAKQKPREWMLRPTGDDRADIGLLPYCGVEYLSKAGFVRVREVLDE